MYATISFIAIQILFLIIACFSSNEIEDIPKNTAVTLHVLAIVCFALGSFFSKNYFQPRKIVVENNIQLGMLFYLSCYSFLALSIFIIFLQIELTYGLDKYFIDLLSNQVAGDEAGLRRAFLTPSNEGGLPGYLKVIASSSLATAMTSLSIMTFYPQNKNNKALKTLFIVSLITIVVKSFFSLDRLSLLGICSSFIIYGLIKRTALKSSFLFLTASLIFLEFISRIRMDGKGILYFISLYFKLGLSNFELVIRSLTEYRYGLTMTMSPLVIIFNYFGLDLRNDIYYDWIWDPAQYGFSLLYIDFGYFFLLEMFLIGMAAYSIERNAFLHYPTYAFTYYVFIYCLISFVVVPAWSGPEFWFILLLTYLLSKTIRIKKI